VNKATYSVFPVQAGWAIEQPDAAPLMFFSGGRAEAKAHELAQLASRVAGIPAQVLIHDRNGSLVGGKDYDPSLDEAAAP